MQITGVNTSAFSSIVRYVSAERYEDNLRITELDRLPLKRNVRIKARLGVLDGKGPQDSCAPGARRSWSGRRGPWACWHAVRDVLNVMFEQYPDAVVTSGIHWRVKYEGLDGFREVYPGTAFVNIGSQVSWVTMPDLCECYWPDPLTAPAEYVIPVAV